MEPHERPIQVEMDRLIKWLLPALILAENAVIGSGLIEARSVIVAAGVVEIVLVAVAGRQLLVAVRRDRFVMRGRGGRR
jgi:hypothetical protein